MVQRVRRESHPRTLHLGRWSRNLGCSRRWFGGSSVYFLEAKMELSCPSGRSCAWVGSRPSSRTNCLHHYWRRDGQADKRSIWLCLFQSECACAAIGCVLYADARV